MIPKESIEKAIEGVRYIDSSLTSGTTTHYYASTTSTSQAGSQKSSGQNYLAPRARKKGRIIRCAITNKGMSKKYLVGYVGREQTARYSREAWSHPEKDGGVELMTLAQARKELKKLKSPHPKAIYEVVRRSDL